MEKSDSSAFDPKAYLDALNTSWRIYKGTPEHVHMKEQSTPLTYEISNMGSPGEPYPADIDSAYAVEIDDHLILGHVFYAKGRCLEFFPYLVDFPDRLVLLSPELVDAQVIIDGNDTSVLEKACAQDMVVDIRYNLPDFVRRTRKPLYFRNKRVVK